MNDDLVKDSRTPEESAADFMREVARKLARKPFAPHPIFKNGHAQTIAAHIWPRRRRYRGFDQDESRLFAVAPDIKLLANCRWQKGEVKNRATHPTLVLLHGLEGSTESIYMLGTAQKAFDAGFNIVRVNMRNCGGSEHLAPTLYNSGMSGDMRAVVAELIEQDELKEIYLAGFSMGGNIVLKLAGEYGEEAPSQLKGVCAVSPAIDLAACADKIAHRSNRIYQQRFLRGLRRRMQVKASLQPDRYNVDDLRRVRSIRDFDDLYTARDGGFKDASEYYMRSSALQFIPSIRIPTLILHAQDDPFIPFDAFTHAHLSENPFVALLAPPRGGHVGFLARRTANGEDAFWAENRIVDFCRMVHDRKAI
jgi:uncharacterized protein